MNKLASPTGNFASVPDWDDVRYAVVLARCGSLAAAARQLAVDQTTVSRRLRVLEACMGTPLFERMKGLLTPTPAGRILLERGERMEQEMAAICHLATDSQAMVQGVIRITAVDALVSHYLARHLAELRGLYPDLSVELIASSKRLDLNRREADIAIRLARPLEGDLVVRCLGKLAYSIYGPPRPDCAGCLDRCAVGGLRAFAGSGAGDALVGGKCWLPARHLPLQQHGRASHCGGRRAGVGHPAPISRRPAFVYPLPVWRRADIESGNVAGSTHGLARYSPRSCGQRMAGTTICS